MTEDGRPGRQEIHHGSVGRALSTSLLGNSPAFGFSITITATFGAITRLEGNARLLEVVLFALAAASAIALLEAVVTRGFRDRAVGSPPEVAMLGTALNVFSVGVGLGSAIGMGLLFGGLARRGIPRRRHLRPRRSRRGSAGGVDTAPARRSRGGGVGGPGGAGGSPGGHTGPGGLSVPAGGCHRGDRGRPGQDASQRKSVRGQGQLGRAAVGLVAEGSTEAVVLVLVERGEQVVAPVALQGLVGLLAAEGGPRLRGLGQREAEEARLRGVACVARLEKGSWQPPARGREELAGHLGLLVIEGLLSRNTIIAAAPCPELLGAGDSSACNVRMPDAPVTCACVGDRLSGATPFTAVALPSTATSPGPASRILDTWAMPAVAACVCQGCGRTEELILVDRHALTTMPPCTCGGRMQVARVFYDRRLRHEPVLNERRASDS